SYQVCDADRVDEGSAKKGEAEVVPDTITPPMPSVVASILVEAGERIEKNQNVVVLSAMKMETTLVAPFAGKVTRVNVAEGDKVMPGQILIDIEKGEDDNE
ncbi:MAG: biotin/lipoyl-binding protein, partial [bacterium]|nr:biotin/lipoyl-binding protein [bacterium]